MNAHTSSDRIQFEINGKPVEAEPGSMVIEAADAAGIRIPRFCYHKKLSVAANCRMCLVEVERAPKPLPACATPVTAGMKVYTHSPKALAAQKAVMEFLLINHPLDCPICDQGGECELQDVSMGYGQDYSHYQEPKRAVPDPDLGPLVATEMTRCIHCTRCIRFGTEIAGIRELGAVGRGEHMRISNYVSRVVHSEISANIIDVCPVGALTSKPYRFQARAWEMLERTGIAVHDRVGSHLAAHVRRGVVQRVVPVEAEAVNETWLSDRDRFSYLGLQSSDRLTQPMVKVEGVWQETTWEEALGKALSGFQAIAAQQGGAGNGFLIHPGSSLEELFLFQQLARRLGSPHIDSRIHQAEYATDIPDWYPAYLQSLAIGDLRELEQADVMVCIGSDLPKEQPLINTRVRKAVCAGAQFWVQSPLACEWNYPVTGTLLCHPDDSLKWSIAVYREVAQLLSAPFPEALQADKLLWDNALEHAKGCASALVAAKRPVILSGAYAESSRNFSVIQAIWQCVYQLLPQSDKNLLHLPQGSNALAAAYAGALPYVGVAGLQLAESGLSVEGMLAARLPGYFLWNIEPEHDTVHLGLMREALQEAQWVVLATPFVTESMLDDADVLLPVAAAYETSGTWVNATADWQSAEAWVAAPGLARPGWRILRVLHNMAGYPDTHYMNAFEVRDAVRRACDGLSAVMPLGSADAAEKLPAVLHSAIPQVAIPTYTDWPQRMQEHCSRVNDLPDAYVVQPVQSYQNDALVRRSGALQAMPQSQPVPVARVNPHTFQRNGWRLDTVYDIRGVGAAFCYSTQLQLDERVPWDTICVDAACAGKVPGGLQVTLSCKSIQGER